MLVASVPGDNKTARMRVWRALKASGAGTLRDGVSVLPASEAARAVFQDQVREVVAIGGSAHVLTVQPEDDAQAKTFRALFDRGEDYARLFRAIDEAKAQVARLNEVEARRLATAVQREVAALVAIDFFPGAPCAQASQALAELEAALNARFSPDEPHAAKGRVPKRTRSDYQGRTWATRARPWVDRIASAWLIRRFIDPKAKILWLKSPKDCPKRALGFDFDGATFTHVGALVSFEVLAASFGLDADPAIVRLGRLVHHLDVGGVPVREAAGFAAILTGARAQHPDDDKLLRAMTPVLDALHASFGNTPGAKR